MNQARNNQARNNQARNNQAIKNQAIKNQARKNYIAHRFNKTPWSSLFGTKRLDKWDNDAINRYVAGKKNQNPKTIENQYEIAKRNRNLFKKRLGEHLGKLEKFKENQYEIVKRNRNLFKKRLGEHLGKLEKFKINITGKNTYFKGENSLSFEIVNFLKSIGINTYLQHIFWNITPTEIDYVLNEMSEVKNVKDIYAGGLKEPQQLKELEQLAEVLTKKYYEEKLKSSYKKIYARYGHRPPRDNVDIGITHTRGPINSHALQLQGTRGGKKKTKKKTTTKTKKKKKVVKQKLHKGPRGGKYYIRKGRKVYV